MTTEELIEKLKSYNNWRRGADIPMPSPKLINEAIKKLKETINK